MSVCTLLVHEQVWSKVFYCSLPSCSETGSLKPEACHVDWTGCPVNELSESICLLTPAWGLQSHLVMSHSFFFLYMGAVDPLSSPACIAITLVH